MLIFFLRHEATPAIWQEVYLSALLRAILYADDANYVGTFADFASKSLSIELIFFCEPCFSDWLDSESWILLQHSMLN